MVKTKVEQSIIDALEAVAADHGVDIVDVEVVGATKAPCVRVRIDNLDGESISLDEVTAQSSWVSDVVEGLDPISSSYTLEVSSPGMARPLRRPSDFQKFIGERCELSTVLQPRASVDIRASSLRLTRLLSPLRPRMGSRRASPLTT